MVPEPVCANKGEKCPASAAAATASQGSCHAHATPSHQNSWHVHGTPSHQGSCHVHGTPAPRAETRPSSPIPPFLLAQNQFSNRIASTEHAAKVRHAMWHHRWLRRLNGGNHNLEEGRLWQKDNQIVDFTAPMIKVINGS